MNRRSFFKVVTGFVAGIFATSAKVKADVTVFPTEAQARKVSRDIYGDPDKLYCRNMSPKEWVDAQFNPVKELQLGEPFTGRIISMTEFQGNLWIATEEGVYRIREGFA